MQQLSEMFNVNHFIISQANPHAYMLSSFSSKELVWNNPVLGFANSVLNFLKNELKAWIRNLVEFVGGRRLAPMWELRRGFFTQLLTQEYEGRDIDITINPWAHHRSLFSAFLHCIYNPSRDDLLEWQLAAERETWKHLPMVRSHCAIEAKLDKCVQKLRKTILTESRERKYDGLGNRVPSFYASPSLVNLGGLGVGDQPMLVSNMSAKNSATDLLDGGAITMDSGSEDGDRSSQGPTSPRSTSSAPENESVYVKTTNMTSFYYRRSKSNEQIHQSDEQSS